MTSAGDGTASAGSEPAHSAARPPRGVLQARIACLARTVSPVRLYSSATLLFALGPLWCVPAYAQEPAKTCPRADVLAMEVSGESVPDGYGQKFSSDYAPVKIEIVPQPARPAPGAKAGNIVTLRILGPVMSSDVDRAIDTALSCTARGVVLSATATLLPFQSRLKYSYTYWRSKITLTLALRARPVTFTSIWKMRLRDGKELSHAQMPDYPDLRYPIVVKKILR